MASDEAVGRGRLAQMMERPQKIPFGEMRDMRVRGFCWSIAPTTAVATRSRSAPIRGPMTCGCPILKIALYARSAASGAGASFHCSPGRSKAINR